MTDKWFLFQEAPDYGRLYFCGAFNGFFDDLKKQAGVENLNAGAIFFDHGTFICYFKENEWHEKGLKVFEKIKTNQKFIDTLFEKLNFYSEKLVEETDKVKQTDLSKLSDEDLSELFHNWFEVYVPLWSWGMIQNLPDFENDYVTKYLLEKVEEKIKQGKIDLKKSIAFSTLVQPLKHGKVQEEETRFLHLISEVKKNAKAVELFRNHKTPEIKGKLHEFPEINSLLLKHFEDFKWIQYNFIGPAFEIDYFIDRISAFIHANENEQEFLKKIEHEKNELKEKQTELLKTFADDKEALKVFSYAKEIAFLKIKRMDASYYFYFMLEKVLREMAKRKNVSLNQIRALDLGQIIEFFLGNKFSQKELNDQFNASIVIYENSKRVKELVGKEAVQEFQKILQDARKVEKKSELRGMPTFPGKVVGKARIILTVKESGKMQEGDILISQATSPDMVPIMKIAGAILTDVGGITCHAAIVSREMRKPCIIGLKTATKNFSDGDLLEVNANHGIVKKVNQ